MVPDKATYARGLRFVGPAECKAEEGSILNLDLKRLGSITPGIWNLMLATSASDVIAYSNRRANQIPMWGQGPLGGKFHKWGIQIQTPKTLNLEPHVPSKSIDDFQAQTLLPKPYTLNAEP